MKFLIRIAGFATALLPAVLHAQAPAPMGRGSGLPSSAPSTQETATTIDSAYLDADCVTFPSIVKTAGAYAIDVQCSSMRAGISEPVCVTSTLGTSIELLQASAGVDRWYPLGIFYLRPDMMGLVTVHGVGTSQTVQVSGIRLLPTTQPLSRVDVAAKSTSSDQITLISPTSDGAGVYLSNKPAAESGIQRGRNGSVSVANSPFTNKLSTPVPPRRSTHAAADPSFNDDPFRKDRITVDR